MFNNKWNIDPTIINQKLQIKLNLFVLWFLLLDNSFFNNLI